MLRNTASDLAASGQTNYAYRTDQDIVPTLRVRNGYGVGVVVRVRVSVEIRVIVVLGKYLKRNPKIAYCQ